MPLSFKPWRLFLLVTLLAGALPASAGAQVESGQALSNLMQATPEIRDGLDKVIQDYKAKRAAGPPTGILFDFDQIYPPLDSLLDRAIKLHDRGGVSTVAIYMVLFAHGKTQFDPATKSLLIHSLLKAAREVGPSVSMMSAPTTGPDGINKVGFVLTMQVSQVLGSPSNPPISDPKSLAEQAELRRWLGSGTGEVSQGSPNISDQMALGISKLPPEQREKALQSLKEQGITLTTAGTHISNEESLEDIMSGRVASATPGSEEYAVAILDRANLEAGDNHRKKALADIEIGLRDAIRLSDVRLQRRALDIRASMELEIGLYKKALATCVEIDALTGKQAGQQTLVLPPNLTEEQKKRIEAIMEQQRQMQRQMMPTNLLGNFGATRRDPGLSPSLDLHEKKVSAYLGLKDEADALKEANAAVDEVLQYRGAHKQDALEIKDSDQDTARAYWILSETLLKLGHAEDAVARLAEAPKVADDFAKSTLKAARSLAEIRAKKANIDLEPAETYFQAIPLTTIGGAEALSRLPDLGSVMPLSWLARGRRDVAIFYGKLDINRIQAASKDARTISKSTGQVYQAKRAPAYRQLADWLAQEGRIAEAQHVLDLLHDEEHFQFIHARSGESDSIPLSSLEQKWLSLSEPILDQKGRVAAALGPIAKLAPNERDPDEQKAFDRLAAQNADLQKQYEAVFNVTPGAKAVHETTESFQRLKSILSSLPQKTAAVYSLVGDSELRLFVTVPGATAPLSVAVPVNRTELNRLVLEFYRSLNDPYSDPRTSGAALYDLVLRPIEGVLSQADISTTIWSLDGTLRYIPLAALYDSKSQRYEIQKRADVVFTPRTLERLLDKGSSTWSAAAFGVSKGGEVDGISFPSLPHVPSELDSVRANASAHEYLDQAFTRGSFDQELEAKTGILHLATHFQFVPGDSSESGLLTGENKLLTIDDIQALKPDAMGSVQLLVLSACQTAIGEVRADGSEFDGVALVAQLKGAKAVLAALWSVDDQSTGMVMGDFYMRLKSHSGITKLQALRSAQLSMLNGGKYAHPFFWAPFVLVGDWR